MHEDVKFIPRVDVIKAIGIEIHRIGMKKGWDSFDIARRSNVSQTMIQRLERGVYKSVPSPKSIMKISHGLGLYSGPDRYLLLFKLTKAMGARVRLLRDRDKRKMRQSDVAKNIGVSRRQEQRYESGEKLMEPHIINELANLFKVDNIYIACKIDSQHIHVYQGHKRDQQMTLNGASKNDTKPKNKPMEFSKHKIHNTKSKNKSIRFSESKTHNNTLKNGNALKIDISHKNSNGKIMVYIYDGDKRIGVKCIRFDKIIKDQVIKEAICNN